MGRIGVPARVLRLVLLFAGSVGLSSLLTGCTYLLLEGGGPLPKEKAFAVYGRAPRTIPAALKEKCVALDRQTDWASLHPVSTRTVEGKERFLRVRLRTQGWTLLIIGYVSGHYVHRFEKNGEPSTVYGKGYFFLPGFPLAWPWWSGGSQIHSASDGSECAAGRFHLLGLDGILGGYWADVAPGSTSALGEELEWDLQGDRYYVKKGVHLAAGLLAWGRVNKRYFIQVLWIPIPIARAD